MSDRGIPASYRHMHGFGSHTFSLINSKSERVWVKFHFITQQGIKNLSNDEAADIIAKDRESHGRDLFDAIERGDYPRWKLCVQIMTEEQARERYGLYGDFSFVIDTDGCTTFDNNLCFPAARTFDLGNYKLLRGTHGYAPEKGPQPTFFAAGPAIKQGITVERGNTLNHAPTMAAILGIELPCAKGKPVTEILR